MFVGCGGGGRVRDYVLKLFWWRFVCRYVGVGVCKGMSSKVSVCCVVCCCDDLFEGCLS